MLLYLMSLISFSSQHRKAAKTDFETVYTFRNYVQFSKVIRVTHYPVEEKLVFDNSKRKKNVAILR